MKLVALFHPSESLLSDQPYPGHDADERISVEELMRGTDVLIEALADLAMTPPVSPPLQAIATQPKIVDGDRHTGER